MNKELTAEEKAALKNIASKLSTFEKQRGNLIPILQMIQEKIAYLPTETLKMVAEHLGILECEVFGVATFYNQFRFHPPGKHPIKVCLGTACHVRGGSRILDAVERVLGIKEGETTPSLEYSLETVACIGACALAPTMVINQTTYGKVTPNKVAEIFNQRNSKEQESE